MPELASDDIIMAHKALIRMVVLIYESNDSYLIANLIERTVEVLCEWLLGIGHEVRSNILCDYESYYPPYYSISQRPR